jgi:cell division topological specificity factor
MSDFFGKLFGGGQPKSSSMAKERLQLVLVHDRSNLTPAQVQAMKDEILEVIAKYVEFDRDAVELDLESDDRQNFLRAEIPIEPGSSRRRRGGGGFPASLGDA